MARRVREPHLGTEQKEHQITEALDRKRKQLDQEVAEFKAKKEYEYRVFEEKLRDKIKQNVVQDGPQSQRKRGQSKQENAAAEAGPVQKEKASATQMECGTGNADQKGPESDDVIAAGRSNPTAGGALGPPDRSTEALHEREKEFQGLFMPSYLPLLGDTSAAEKSRPKEFLQPPFFNPGDLSAARQQNSAMLSSSAETVHPPMTSPPLPPVRPLSSSVPPEKPSHHRSDSSRSDTSIASLRSSLRDPKQPRSPKRVLFSIDDTLVSPSTSPIAQRLKSTKPTNPGESVNATSGFEKFEVVRNQNGNSPPVNRFQNNDVGFSSSSAPANGWTTSLSTFGRAAKSNLSKPSPGGADLESDGLFTFDEDMGWEGKDKSQETDPEEEYDEDMDTDEKKSKDPVTTSSPHAGSLPIRIRWPGRRESRG